MPPKKIKTSTKTTNRKTKKPLIKRIRLGRLLLVLILLSSIVYGSYIVISEIYSWGSFKYAQYQEAHPSKPQNHLFHRNSLINVLKITLIFYSLV